MSGDVVVRPVLLVGGGRPVVDGRESKIDENAAPLTHADQPG